MSEDGVCRLKQSLEEHISNLESVNHKLQNSLDNIVEANRILEDDKYKGHTQVAALYLIYIFKIYHKKLLEVNKNKINALKELDECVKQHMNNDGSIP